MRRIALLLIASGIYGDAAEAQEMAVPQLAAAAVAQPSAMETGIAQLQNEWAVIKYQTPSEEQQEKVIEQLATKAAQFVAQNPGKAEPLIWQGIILATKAGIDGGVSALSDAKAARAALESAEKLDPRALNGSVYTSLGSLYHKVPGWPLGFGDNDKAKEYLEKALSINPDGIDSNFFYGEFLYDDGDYARAQAVLEHGLKAPMRPGRELADKGRAEEIRELLVKVQKKLKG